MSFNSIYGWPVYGDLMHYSIAFCVLQICDMINVEKVNVIPGNIHAISAENNILPTLCASLLLKQ